MKHIISIFFLAVFVCAAHASLDVQIDSSPAHMDESFQLILTQSGQAKGAPDLRGLQKDFRILGTARQVSYAVINGQSTLSSQWVITLKPLKSGVLSIPAIKIGSEQSNPMTINVESSTSSTVHSPQEELNGDSQALMLHARVDGERPYINQEVIYTVTLYNSKRLLDAQYEPPQAEDTLIIPLGDTKHYQTVQDNVAYVVEEQKYALFPQKSGLLTIHSPSFTALVYNFDTQRVSVRDKDSQLEIQPIPKQYTSGQWLPAKNVLLTEQYEQTGQSMVQGSTLVRTITVQGGGIPAQLIPSLHFDSTDEFAVYPEKGKEQNSVKDGQLQGTIEFKVTYLFNKPGTVLLPEVRLPWFNTQTGEPEVAILAPRSLEIIPVVGTPDIQAPPVINVLSSTDSLLSVPKKHTASLTTISATNNVWLVALFFAVAWLATLCLWGWQKHRKNKTVNNYKKIQAACRYSNPHQARDALLLWARVQWPDAAILNLDDVSLIVHDSALKQQIQVLSQALYQHTTSTSWQGETLWQVMKNFKPLSSSLKVKDKVLPPLHP